MKKEENIAKNKGSQCNCCLINSGSGKNIVEKTMRMKKEENIAKNEESQCYIMDVELGEDTVEKVMRDEESWTDHYCEEDTYEEDIVMKEVDYHTMDEKRNVAPSGESQLDSCMLVVEENVAGNEKSESATLIEDENQETGELNLSSKKKESGYFEDNHEKMDNIIENYTKQYGGEILSIGCSVSTESNELIIDEEAGLLDQENSEQDFTSSCSTETMKNLDDDSEKSVFVADDLDIMETIEIGETNEDDLMQIQYEQWDPLSNIKEEIYIDRGNNVIFNQSIKKRFSSLIKINGMNEIKMNEYNNIFNIRGDQHCMSHDIQRWRDFNRSQIRLNAVDTKLQAS